ncbi:MAG: general stress protein [Edaphobacter sp.]
MSTMNSVVAVYDTHEQAEAAIKELQEAGVDMKSLSIAGKDTHTDEHVVGYYNAGDRMKYWGKLGAFWGASGDCFLDPLCSPSRGLGRSL